MSRSVRVNSHEDIILINFQPDCTIKIASLETAVKDDLVFTDVGIHSMERSFDFRLKEGVEFFEERFQMCEVIVQKIVIFVTILFCYKFLHFERTDRSWSFIRESIPR